MTSINSKASSDKRAIESAVHTMHAEIDDMLQQAKNSEEKSKKAMVDAARLADELRAEQDHTISQDKAKLETRIRELEVELGNVQARTGESTKAFQKAERRSASSRWSWATCRRGPARAPRPSRRQRGDPRSSASRLRRTRRTRRGCRTSPPSC